jgi:hypothetical protein
VKKILMILILIIFAFAVLDAGTYEHEEGGISIWFPDHWKVQADGDDLDVEAPDQDAFAYLMVLDNVRSVEEGVNAYVSEIQKSVRRFKIISEGEDIQMNGVSIFYIEGEGVMNGVDVESSAAIIVTNRAYVMMMTINVEASRRKYKRDFKQIIESISAI